MLGTATAIGYRSDKWEEPGVTHDYIHRHRDPLPEIVLQRPSDKDVKRLKNLESDPLHKTVMAELFEQEPIEKEEFSEPEKFYFAQLGYALDLEYVRDGRIQQIDWKENELPILAADLKRNLLVIIPTTGGFPVLVWSPILKVTPRGIEN